MKRKQSFLDKYLECNSLPSVPTHISGEIKQLNLLVPRQARGTTRAEIEAKWKSSESYAKVLSALSDVEIKRRRTDAVFAAGLHRFGDPEEEEIYDFHEHFAGMHKLTNVVRSYGFRARMFDVPCPVLYSKRMDILTSFGFLLAMNAA
ncbi:unnamed protein product [Symbiodinium necroappetens]|uniref:Uncharacterized protein n=1 Tax=Symbiodinium necroappetens TaxID=1628268 RepID=A0A812T3M0_9DINO|nr:unnamed protein product [Symbiodinium necroappetens]